MAEYYAGRSGRVERSPGDVVRHAIEHGISAPCAAALTGKLLAFSRQQPLAPKVIDANKLVSGTCDFLRRSLGEEVSLETVLAAALWRTHADPNQLENALLNLALNARDAMPNGGKLTIETSNVVLDDSYASLNIEVTAGPYVLIAVTDSGHGIPADILNNVFEPFFTTKDIGKGSGLGLSMVYGFVKQSNGHIKIYSEEGHGTTVRIYLPQALGLAQPEDELASTSILEGGNETVLVVEDDDLVRTFVVGQIQSLGYVTLAAVNADEALVLINSAQTIDLLFTDMIMPGSMNGRQLSDEALRRRPSLSVLFTSGYTENTVIHYGRLDAGVLLLAKPYRKSDLARMIRSALGADTKLQPPTPDPVGKGASKPSRTAA
jgi:CheY-like chemotaxis protein